MDWYVKAEDIALKNKGNQNAGNSQNITRRDSRKNKVKNISHFILTSDKLSDIFITSKVRNNSHGGINYEN